MHPQYPQPGANGDSLNARYTFRSDDCNSDLKSVIRVLTPAETSASRVTLTAVATGPDRASTLAGAAHATSPRRPRRMDHHRARRAVGQGGGIRRRELAQHRSNRRVLNECGIGHSALPGDRARNRVCDCVGNRHPLRRLPHQRRQGRDDVVDDADRSAPLNPKSAKEEPPPDCIELGGGVMENTTGKLLLRPVYALAGVVLRGLHGQAHLLAEGSADEASNAVVLPAGGPSDLGQGRALGVA